MNQLTRSSSELETMSAVELAQLDDDDGEPCDPHLLSLCVKLEQRTRGAQFDEDEDDLDDCGDDDCDDDDDLDDDDDDLDSSAIMGGEKQSSKRCRIPPDVVAWFGSACWPEGCARATLSF
jgi:hypothetical protein